MEFDAARDYVRTNHNGVLSTFRRDGSPQLSPNTATVGTDGRLWISSRETAFKVKNLRRDPRTAWCGIGDKFFSRWVQIDGTAEIVALPDAMEMLVWYYRNVSGEHPDWPDYRAAMIRDQRVIIAITITGAGPDRHG